MDVDGERRARVRKLREKGLSPKEIARAVGAPRAKVTALLRDLAAAGNDDAAERAVLECWVSPGWSAGLTVTGQDWPDDPDGDPGKTGIAQVLVVRDAGRHRVSVCGYLVDVYCLGVKNTIGPEMMDHHAVPGYVRAFFQVFDRPPLRAPFELAQHLILGAVEYAHGLGFEPMADSDYDRTVGHLGAWNGPSAIGFGRDGRPLYVAGPRDDPEEVVRTLRRSVGEGNFEFSVALPV